MGTISASPPGTPSFPPECGQRTIPSLIDARSRADHARPFACISTSAGVHRDVSYREFANAVNRCTRWLQSEVGVSQTFESLAYLGPGDLRYEILLVAAIKTGHVLFVPSPRNNEDAFHALLEECKPSTLLLTSQPTPAAAIVTRIRPSIRQHVVPELDALLDPSPVEPVPFSKEWAECRWDPFVRVHTSGSTGTPKLVTLPHGSFCAADAMQMLSGNELTSRFGEMRVLSCFPHFHVAGITYNLAMPLWFDYTVVLPPVGPLTADVIHRTHVDASVEFTMLPPSLLIDLAANPTHMDYLCNLRGVGFAGGPLPESIGSRIASRTKLVASIGTTELVTLPQVTKQSSDWPYFAFDIEGGGYEFQKRDDLFELVVHRRPELDLFQPVFVAFPDLNVFHTKDLYEKHPDPAKPHLWRYRSRLDDIIVFSNGEKLNPVTMEAIVSGSPAVKGCLVFGQGHFQAGMLIEPQVDWQSEATLMDEVRPLLKKSNAMTVNHGRVMEDMIIITHPDKPLARAGKGTLQRAANMKLYGPEIAQAYSHLEAATPGQTRRTPMPTDLLGIRDFLSDIVQAELGVPDTVSDTADFSALGLDSLQLITLRRTINAARPPDRALELKLIYDNPSVRQLAAALAAEDPPRPHANPYDSDDERMQASWLAMDRIYNEMTSSWTAAGQHPAGQEKAKRRAKRWRHRVRDALRSTERGRPIIPRDGGAAAWRQVLGSLLIHINTAGLVYAFGALQAHYASTLLRAHPASAIACIGTLQGALALLVAGLASGPLSDTGYSRLVAGFAATGVVAALMLLSLCRAYGPVLLAHALLGLASGVLCEPSQAPLPAHFKHRRGLALGIATGGGPLGGAVYSAVFTRLIHRVGFAGTIRVFALIALATLGVALSVMQLPGARPRRQVLHAYAFRDRRYLAFALSAFLVSAGLLVPFFLSTTYAAGLGVGPHLSPYLLPCMNVCQFVGRAVSGWWSDYHHRHLGPESVLFLAELAAGVLGFGWIGVHTLGGYGPWLVCYGFVSGFVTTMPAVVLPHLCPNMAVYGTRLGMLRAIAGLGLLISAPVASTLNAVTGNAVGSQVWTGVCCTAGALCLCLVTPYVNRRRILSESGTLKRTFTWQQKRIRI